MSNTEGFNIELDQWILNKLYSLIEVDEERRKRGEPASRPYVLEGQPEDEKMTLFSSEEKYQDSVDSAIKYSYEQSTKEEQECIVLFFDGYIRLHGVRRDAFLYQVYSKNKKWLQFAQAYRPKGIVRQYKRIGDLIFIGEVEYPSR